MELRVEISPNFPLLHPIGRDDVSEGDRFPALAIVGYSNGNAGLITCSKNGLPIALPLALFSEFGRWGERLPQDLPAGWVFLAGRALFAGPSPGFLSLFVGYPELLEESGFLSDIAAGDAASTDAFDRARARAMSEEVD